MLVKGFSNLSPHRAIQPASRDTVIAAKCTVAIGTPGIVRIGGVRSEPGKNFSMVY